MNPGAGERAWPFVGRDAELTRVADGSSGALLAGPSGIGKSRLLAEAVAGIPPDDHRVVRIAATESLAAVPFGAFAGVLACDLDPGAPFTALSRALQALAGSSSLDRVVLAVDDAHLLDDASAGLVLLAAQAGTRVLATVRTGVPVPDAVTRLWTEDHATRVEIAPLDDDRVGGLLHQVLGGPLDSRSRQRLLEATGGNLLFLRELVRHALEQNALLARDGMWSWNPVEAVAPGILELIDRRLQSVSVEAYGVVEVLAVCEPLGHTVVETVTSRAACRAALADGIVAQETSGRRDDLRLVHPLYVQVVRSRLGPVRRSEIAALVADVLAGLGARRRDDQLRAAVLQLDAGVYDDPRALDAAAREAGSRGDLPLALRFARAAVDAGGATEGALLLGTILYWAGQHEELVDLLGAPLSDATPDQVASAALLVASSLYYGSGRFEEADDRLCRAIEEVGPEHAQALVAQRSQILMFAGRALESIEVGRPVLDDPSASVDARLRAYSGVLVSEAMCGEVAAVEAELPSAMQLVLEAVSDLSIYTSGGVVVATFVVRLFSGQLDQVDAFLAGLHADAARRVGDPFVGAWSLLLGRSALAQGRLADAITHSRDAASLLGHRDFRGILPWTLATLAQALGAKGDADGARDAIDALRDVRMPAMHHIDVDIELGAAWAAAARGERSHARRDRAEDR